MWLLSLALSSHFLYDPQMGGDTIVSVDMYARSTAVSMTPTLIACLLSDGSVRVLDAATGILSSKIEGLAEGSSRGVIAMRPDGKVIALGGFREIVLEEEHFQLGGQIGPFVIPLYEENVRAERYNVPGHAPLNDIHKGIPAPRGGSLSVWRTSDGQKITERNDFPLPISGITFDGPKIKIVDRDLNVFQFDNNLGKIYQIDTPHTKINVHSITSSKRYPVPQIVFSKDANKILCLSGGNDGMTNLISGDLSTKRSNDMLRKSLTLPPWAATLSPDGRRFATSGPEWSLNLWDFDTGRILKSIKSDEDAKTDLLFLSFCSDSERLLTSSSNGMIRVIDTNSGKTLLTGQGPKNDVRAAVLKDDHLTIVSGGYRYNREGTKIEPLIIWNLKLKAPPSP